MKFLLLPLVPVVIFTIALVEAGSVDNRNLQSSVSFVANYSAGFQYLQDPLCVGDPPVIHITCGGKNLTILGYSDPSISCTKLSTPDFPNGTTHECKSNCSDCSDVYLTNGDVRDGPFASIYFACEGDTVQSVSAVINYLGGNSGNCAGASVTPADTRNFHVARLGVSCPVGVSREYVYDDTYFECAALVPVEIINTAVIGEDDVYSCANGMNCKGQECTVTFSNLFINADFQYFLNSCVDSTVPIPSFPTLAPISPIYEYSVQFQAIWGRLFSPTTATSVCNTGNSAVVVSCGNGASILFVNASDVTMACTPMNENELGCIGDSNGLNNILTTVTFECQGPNLPSASVTYPGSTTAFCDGNTENTTVRHAVGLNVLCTAEGRDYFYTGDNFFECSDLSDRFDALANEFGLDMFIHFVCSQYVVFPAGSIGTNSQELRSVTVTTDSYWQLSPDVCFNRTALSRTPTNPSSPTPSPATNPQASPFPIESPSEKELPTQSPVGASTIPTAASSLPTKSENKSSNAGAIAGGSIAAIAVVAIVAFLLVRKKSQSESRDPKPHGSGAGVSSAQSISEAHTDFPGSSVAPPTVVASPYAAPSRSLAIDVANAQAPVQPQAIRTSYSGTPIPLGGSHDVHFKDQARSVIGPSQSSVPMVVPGVPMAEAIPIAVAMDTSAASGNSRNSIKSEPPGRRGEDP